MNDEYPVALSIDYPDRDLNRVTTALRIFAAIPIAIVLGTIAGITAQAGSGNTRASTIVVGGTGLLFLPPLLMIVFREKYPRWWFDWNRELLRFTTRVVAYLLLMDDRYPSTDAEQAVHLDLRYPEVRQELNRWLPLVKWFLAIPHYIALFFIDVGAFFVVVGAWFAILLTGRYPRSMFDYLEGALRWHSRVVAYAFILITDDYPPFQLRSLSPPTSGEPAST